MTNDKAPLEWTREQKKQFWQEVREALASGRCDFSGENFPDDPKGRTFLGLTFSERADFTDTTFHGHVSFWNAKFKGEATFGAGQPPMKPCIFKSEVHFEAATFERGAHFIGVEFREGAFFDTVTFKKGVTFRHATFEGTASFTSAVIEQFAGFTGTVFKGEAIWLGAQANGQVNLGASEQEDVDAPSAAPVRFRYPADGKVLYRLAKQSAQDRGDYPQAGEYFYAECCAATSVTFAIAKRTWRKAIDEGSLYPVPKAIGKTFTAATDWFLGKVVLGYGERTWNPLFTGFAVIVAFAVIYGFVGNIDGFSTARVSWFDRIIEPLYFSTVTFTTLGYGDLKPVGTCTRILAASEAMLGASIMALFVVALARKFTR